MSRFLVLLCCALLLAGCAAPVEAPEVPLPDNAPAEPDTVEYAAALTVPLADLEPYEPWVSMEPDTAGLETMGEVLCDKTLPGGTRVVCYWHPDRLTNPDYRYEKYWAIHQGDKLLRFAAETSGYEQGYDVTAFSHVLGKNGFCIEAPRGMAYTAYDYYVFDETGVPRLLMDCSNDVLEQDVDGDGVRELLWNYHGGQFVTCAFLRESTVYQVEMMSLLADHLPILGLPAGDLKSWGAEGLPVSILAGGWTVINEPGPKTHIEGYLRLTEDSLTLYVPENLIPLEAWAGKRYTLINGAPACRDIVPEGEPEGPWTVLGPAVPAPREWAGQDLAGRNETETWTGIEPSHLFMEMVSVRDGWMVVSISHGVGANADNYVYRTHDGGATWQEAAKLEEAGRYPCAAGFFDNLHAVVGIERFDGVPVFATRDGGESWERAVFSPLDSPDGWQAYSISHSGDEISISLRRGAGDGTEYCRLISRDWGKTWEAEE
ncbi:hypothetical protein [uncultured Oscillibacter sp.]|jgi:hypothetical protein|uniref:WD40/YVTN/BNR-like repeat-containing protein n=1 Tax=uncultured Oscillibacter sp. TaxID=876091 RepID=UPI0025E9D9AC|nr:hypothetical protein [uncultured Oscillibacter sp.]